MSKGSVRSGVWRQNWGFTGRWELDAKSAGHATTQGVNLRRPLSLDGLNRTVCEGKGQIWSDPDCLSAGCKLDDLICPTPKGFVTQEGKKSLASLGTAVAFGGERGRFGFLGFVQRKGFLFHQIL